MMPFSFINVMCSSFYRQKRMRCIAILPGKEESNYEYYYGHDDGSAYELQLIATPASYTVVA
jgi:hypothetical protein